MKKKVYRERYRTIEEVFEKEEDKEAKLLEELKAGAEEQARMLLEASLKESEESKEVIN